MRLRVIAVGKDRKRLLFDAAREYSSRVGRYLPFQLVEVAASRHSRPKEARREEASRILSLCGQDKRLFTLEVGGRQMSSEALANLLGRLMQEGRDVDLVVGGDEGLDSSLSARAEGALSLGPMTLPHQLARVVLLEQLYRAMTILRGEPYHK